MFNLTNDDNQSFIVLCVAYCSPGAQAQLPGGGLAFEVNSSLNFVCPVGSFLSGPSAIACSHLLNNTIISHCEGAHN